MSVLIVVDERSALLCFSERLDNSTHKTGLNFEFATKICKVTTQNAQPDTQGFCAKNEPKCIKTCVYPNVKANGRDQ